MGAIKNLYIEATESNTGNALMTLIGLLESSLKDIDYKMSQHEALGADMDLKQYESLFDSYVKTANELDKARLLYRGLLESLKPFQSF